MPKGVWLNSKTNKKVTGFWEWYWPGQFFKISLDQRDSVTGLRRNFRSYNEKPEWGNFKLQVTKD